MINFKPLISKYWFFTCLNWERHFAPPLSKNFSTFFENKKSRLFQLRNRRLNVFYTYSILIFFLFVFKTLNKTSSTASVYMPCSINLFFRFIRETTISFLFLYLNIYGIFLLSYYPPRCFYLIWWYIKEKILSNMQKGFCPK